MYGEIGEQYRIDDIAQFPSFVVSELPAKVYRSKVNLFLVFKHRYQCEDINGWLYFSRRPGLYFEGVDLHISIIQYYFANNMDMILSTRNNDRRE